MVKVAVPRETLSGETRVALVPESVARLVRAGVEVVVQSGAGERASLLDKNYEQAGATIARTTEELYSGADVVARVQRPTRISRSCCIAYWSATSFYTGHRHNNCWIRP